MTYSYYCSRLLGLQSASEALAGVQQKRDKGLSSLSISQIWSLYNHGKSLEQNHSASLLTIWAITYGHNFFCIFLTLLTMMVFIVIKGNFLLQHTLRAGTLTIRKKSEFPHEQAFSPKMCYLIALTTVKNNYCGFLLWYLASVILRICLKTVLHFTASCSTKIWLARTMLLFLNLKLYLELGPFLLVCIKPCYWSARGANVSVFCNANPN